MSNITERDIIEYLREKIKFHVDEAKRMQELLAAFDKLTPSRPGRKPTFAAIEAAFESRRGNVQDDKHRSETRLRAEGPKPGKQLEVPAEYKDNLTLSSKIAYALHEIHDGFKEDIAVAMAQHEHHADPERISKQISGVLSAMKTKGQLRAEKIGRKDRFYMIEHPS